MTAHRVILLHREMRAAYLGGIKLQGDLFCFFQNKYLQWCRSQWNRGHFVSTTAFRAHAATFAARHLLSGDETMRNYSALILSQIKKTA